MKLSLCFMVGEKSLTWSWCSVEGSRTSLLIWVIKWDLKSGVFQVVWGFLYKSLVLSSFTSELWQGICTYCLTEISASKDTESFWVPEVSQHLANLAWEHPYGLCWLLFCIIHWCTWNTMNLDVIGTCNLRWNLHINVFNIWYTFAII